MTDKQIETMIYDNMPLLDIPENISYDSVLEKLDKNNKKRGKTIHIRRILSIAASFIVVIIGLLAISTRLNLFKMASSDNKYDQALAPMPDPMPAAMSEEDSDEGVIMAKEYKDSLTSENDSYMQPENQETEAYIPSDEEITLVAGTEKELEIGLSFGKNAKICYYDSEGNIVEQEALQTEIIDSENNTILLINAVKACNYTVMIEENNDIYRINVVVLEE